MDMKKIIQKPYIYWMGGIAFSYIALNIFLSKFYLTLLYMPYFFDTMNWRDFLLSMSFTILIGILVAVNMVTAYLHYQETKKHLQKNQNNTCAAKDTRATVFASFGAFVGLAIGVCSACTPSLLLFLFSIFGVTLTWSSLLINGFYVQILLVMLLVLNIYYFQWHQNKKTNSSSKKFENKQGG